jgi:hypothetical protein
MYGRYRGMGNSDGRRTPPEQLLPNLGQMPLSHLQKAMLDARARAIATAPPFVHPDLTLFGAPGDSDSFTITPVPFVSYPTPIPVGGPVVVIQFAVPRSKLAIIRKLSIVHFGGQVIDGSGLAVWRVLKNGGGLRGLSTLTSQYGTYAAPKDVNIVGIENDLIQVTVECPQFMPDGVTPNLGPPAGSHTAASFDGFMYPLSEATQPQQGTY